MKREVNLKEYFQMKSSDREDCVEDIAALLSAWEPSMRSHIEEILDFAWLSTNEDANDAAIELLSKIKSIQLIHSLRSHVTAVNKKTSRNSDIINLICSIAQNINLDYDIRFDTLEYYVHNPRYKFDQSINEALSEAFELLEAELKEKLENLKTVQILLKK